MSDLEIVTQNEKLDIFFIHQFISNSYWGKNRTINEMKICINNSLNFGVFMNEKQIGYARVVTDYSQFAYLMDVFIDLNYRGNGYGKLLINFILNFDCLSNVKLWRLATSNTHGLYEKFGFQKIKYPEKFMELIR